MAVKRETIVRAQKICSASVVLAALVAEGKTEIEDIHHIERGYDDIVAKLSAIGASIKKITVPDTAAF